MTLATLWRAKATQRLRVYTKCLTCGCEHPRSYSRLQRHLMYDSSGYLLPCVRCTENSSSHAITTLTKQVIVVTTNVPIKYIHTMVTI